MPKQQNIPTLAELRADAIFYAQKILETVPFPAEGLTEERRETLYSTIQKQIVFAWAVGYAAGRK